MSVVFRWGNYELRTWQEEDIGIEGFPPPNCSLYKAGSNVGAAIMISDNNLLAIKVKPKGSGLGTDFVKLLMARAKSLGQTVFRVESVTGLGGNNEEITQNRQAMTHVLQQLGFKKQNDHWEVSI